MPGTFPSERYFDFAALAPLRARLVELDPQAMDPEAIAQLLFAARLDFVFTTAYAGVADGGHAAASMHHAALACAAAPDDLRVVPRQPLAVERLSITLPAPPGSQLRGWLHLGAWVCGDPALIDEPRSAGIPLLLPLSRLRARSARRFLAAAA